MRTDDRPHFLFITDLHFSGHKPLWRVGDFFEDAMAKLRDVGKIAKEKSVKRIIIGGDITESPNITLELGDRIVDEIESWKIPVFVVSGNHDVNGNSLATLSKCWLGHIFRRSSVIKPLDTIYDDNVVIWGIPFDEGVEEYLKSEQHLTESVSKMYTDIFDNQGNIVSGKKKYEKLILIVHAMITPNGMHPDARQVKIDEVRTMASVIFSGDYHPGWKDTITRMDLAMFVNPGAMTRKSVSESDCNRKIRCAILNNDLSVEYVPLPSAKDANQVFDFDGASRDKGKREDLERLLGNISDEKAETENQRQMVVDVRERIEMVAKRDNFTKNIVTTALGRYDQFAAEKS